MLKNYFRIAWRNLLKNRTSSIINIAGLATGMAIALIIGLWIVDELSFDHYHTRHSRLARGMVIQSTKDESYVGETVAMPLGEALRTQYKDLFKITALMHGSGNPLIAYKDKKLKAVAICAQPELPEMFTFRMLKGDLTSYRDPSTALISQSLATALFGNDDPINKDIVINSRLGVRIGGVYEDLPQNTTFADTKLLLPWYNKDNNYHATNTNWVDHNGELYVQLADGVTAEQASARIRKLPTPFVKGWLEEAMIYPLDKAHLYNEFQHGKAAGGRIQFVWLFGIIGAFVLLLACINFMNLSTARSEKRAKEVGIRKTMGSLQQQLVTQFLSESVLIAVLAFLLTLVIAGASLPFFNSLSAKNMTMPWSNGWFWLLSIGFVLFTGILAGSYPAFYLSRFDPVKVLKGTFRAGRSASLPREVLVVLQFTVSLTLIIGTFIVFRQINFAKGRPAGYDRDRLLTIYMGTPNIYQHYDAIRQDLLQKGVVDNVAASSMKPTWFNNNNSLYWRGKRPDQESVFFRNVNVTRDFGKTVGWHVIQGRDFSRDFSADSGSLILNAAAAKVIGIKNLVGETMKFFGKDYKVVGVVDDMVTNSVYDHIEPAVFLGDGYHDFIVTRLRAGLATGTALAGMADIFKKYDPGTPFTCEFIDADYARKFETEQRIGNLAAVFTTLAIFISCIGLFGLSSFMAEQRTKEIGVRKVLGASILTLWSLLSKDFVRLVVVSFCIAMPLAYYGMDQWLQSYTYRTDLSWWVFAASGMSILAITLMTVSFQSIRAATMNPSKSLRAE